jgi:putative DNA primase/helicase
MVDISRRNVEVNDRTDRSEASDFLQHLAPDGPWLLTAIIPDDNNSIRTRTFTRLDEARRFIVQHEGDGENIYYSINPTKTALRKKATKRDIARIEYLQVDPDPADDEDPQAFKARLREKIEAYPQQPTFWVDSGNGIQLLFRLRDSVEVTDDRVIEDIEARNYALAIAFGAAPVTRNIDRIFRLPGTTNYPNAKKLRIGRVVCPTKLIRYSNVDHPLADFPPRQEQQDRHGDRHDRRDGQGRDETRSGYAFRFFASCKARGMNYGAAWEAMIQDRGPAGEWVRQADIREIQRTWERAPAKNLDDTVKPQGKKTYRLVKAEDVIIRPLQWVWPGHLLRGAQELMTGIKGMGKSQIQCSLVACATTGRPWPNGAAGIEPGNVIMVTAEDQMDTVVVPRLMAAGADLSRIRFLEAIKYDDDKERMFLLGEDIAVLEQIIKDVGDICMVAIDPITAFMGKINSSSPTDVRGQLGPLAKLAERTDVAFSTVTHPPKQNNQGAINSFIGSQSFIAAARVGHLCVPEMKVNASSGMVIPTGRKLFTSVQGNHQPMPAIAYSVETEIVRRSTPPGDREAYIKSIVEQVEAVKIVWDKELDITADEALRATTHKGPSQTEQVDDFLRDLLAAGPVLSKIAAAKAKARGFSADQVDRARKRLEIEADHLEDG